MKTMRLIALILICLCLVGCKEKDEVKPTFFDTQRGFINVCPECSYRGVVLDWDSIKTGLLKNTPTSQRVYRKCPNGCPIPEYYMFKGRQFVVEEQKDKTYKIIELADDGLDIKRVYDYE